MTSAHLDTFCADNLPPRQQWPEFPGLEALTYPARLNCAVELLDRNLATRADHVAIQSPGETLTYAELAERVNRIANVLVHRMWLVPGNRVLLRGPNSPWMVAAYFAVLKAGGVVVASMPLLRAKELSQMLDRARISHALCDARLADELARAAARAGLCRAVGEWRVGGDVRRAGRNLHRLRHGGRRCLPARLHLRHHRRAQGHDAFPPRHAGDLRRLFGAGAAAGAGRRVHRLAAARLHLRPGRAGAVPVPRRRHRHAARTRLAR